MRILGINGGHDLSYCILEDGEPILHVEQERISRVKNQGGNPYKFVLDNCDQLDTIDAVALQAESQTYRDTPEYKKIAALGKVYDVWHHTSHAAHAFYSSTFTNSLIVTIDGSGQEDIGSSSFCIYEGRGTSLSRVWRFEKSIGNVWSVITRLLGLSTSGPAGNQAGTVMAMAAYGDPRHFSDGFTWGGTKSEHRRIWKKKYTKDNEFDIAAGLQEATEQFFMKQLNQCLGYIRYPDILGELVEHSNICIAGGCALNAVLMGKLVDKYPDKTFYVPPVPYDAGLSLGAAQYVWHQLMWRDRKWWETSFPPYLGREYSKVEIENAIQALLDN